MYHNPTSIRNPSYKGQTTRNEQETDTKQPGLADAGEAIERVRRGGKSWQLDLIRK